MRSKYLFVGALLLLLVVVLAACSPAPAPTTVAQVPTQAEVVCPEAPACPTPPPVPEPVVGEVPFEEMWANSPHNDASAEAFIHWNEEDPKEIPVACATCHSTLGYQDFLGADGSEAGKVDQAAPIGTTVQCVACHNAAAAILTSVTFPSGAVVDGLGSEARCLVCHQGRASKVQLDTAFERYGITEDVDTVPAPVEDRPLGFVNIHYFAAAATLYGTETKGGYEYEGKTYDAKNDHVAGFDTCVGCHNSHTLELKLDACATCHAGVASAEDVKNIRMAGSAADYDGDGDTAEGIAGEIESLQGMLMQAIQAYGTEKAGAAIAYSPTAYPYFFADPNGDGQLSDDEATPDNGYKNWTARLLKAAYNYQTSAKDPGAYAHGGKYIIQLLYDSIEDLNSAIATPVDLSAAHRIDPGHFAGSEAAFRHWDEDGLVPGDCAKCHSATGLVTFLDEASRARDTVTGVNIAAHPANGLNCATCHSDLASLSLREVAQVKFPSGKILDSGSMESNLCLQCHQGRESTVSVNRTISTSGAGDDEISERISFRNPHYFAAGATLMGSESQGAYEYAGQTYNGRNKHVTGFDTCIGCHDSHALAVKVEACGTCHQGTKTTEDLMKIRITPVDFDGDGNATEGLAEEVSTMEEALYTAIQAYATENEAPIVYDSHAYPYFFADANANGTLDEGEAGYASWTPRLLRAAFNFQWVQKDPGAYAHNGEYILQILYDSLKDIGADVSTLTRPEVAAPAQ